MCSDLTLTTHGNRWQGNIKRILGHILFFGLFFVLVSLGFWQLSRGYKRQALEQAYTTRQQQTLNFKQLFEVSNSDKLTGVKASLKLSPTKTPLIMLDNQIVNGKVGYMVYQLMQISATKPWLLVELGFISAYAEREKLPLIEKMNQAKTLTGRVYHTSPNPFSHALMPETGDPLRIQNLNYNQLGHLLGHRIVSFALQPEQVFKSQDGRILLKSWRPITMSSKKNFGYAAQWFAMATALAVIGVFIVIRRRKFELGKTK